MKVECEVEYVDLDAERGVIPGVTVTCSRCDHSVSSYGQGENSVKRCFALLHEECPEDESNFYTTDE